MNMWLRYRNRNSLPRPYLPPTNELSIRELAEVILELTGSRSRIIHRPLPSDDPQRRRPDISEADRLLDWRQTSLREGLTKTIPYFEQLLAEGKILSASSMTGADGFRPVART